VNIAAAMAALKVRDLDNTARHVLLALACHADREQSVAKVRLLDLADELGVCRGNIHRAVRRAEKAGHVSVEKVGHTGRPWHISVAPARANELELVARARAIAENSARWRDNSARQRAPVKKKIFRSKDLEGAARPLASTASGDADVPAPVDKRSPAGIPPTVASAARAALNGPLLDSKVH
jgi:DNA-binding MarR family transcriptional regulator